MAQIPAMLFASSGAGVSSHPAANASSRDFDTILAALTPDTQLPHLPAVASLSEYTSLHDYRALPSPRFDNPIPAFGNVSVSLPAPTIPALKSSVALPVAMTPVTMRDPRKPDQETPKPAAPSRTVAPASPSVTLNVPQQPIAPSRPIGAPIAPVRSVAAPAPANASSAPGIGASDTTDRAAPSAPPPSLSSNLAPLASQAEATDEPDQAQPITSPTNLPHAPQGETPHSTSSDAAQRQDAEPVLTSKGAAETPRSAASNSVAQQSPVRIAPGTTLPQHVVDAIIAAVVDSTDLPPMTMPERFTDKTARPDARPQTSNMKSAASGLPPAVSGSDRVVKTSASVNARSRGEAVTTPVSKSVDSGSRQAVSRDPNQATPPSPAKANDVPLKVLEPIIKAAGANVTMRHEDAPPAPTEIEQDHAVRQPAPAVANTDAFEAHRETQPAQSRIVVADQTVKPSYSHIADSGIVAERLSAKVENSEIGDARLPAQNASATLSTDTIAKQAPVETSDSAVGNVKSETHQGPAPAASLESAVKPRADVTDPESAPTHIEQKPAVSTPANQTAKTDAVSRLEIADANPAATSLTESVANPEVADTDLQKTQVSASAAQSAPAKNADASKPQAATQAQPRAVAVEVIDPAEMLVSEPAQATAADDIPAQAHGLENKSTDGSPVAPKPNCSPSASLTSEQQFPIMPATAAPAAKTTSDAPDDTSAANDAAAQSQTEPAASKVEAAQAASSGPAVPGAPSTSQPDGATLVAGVAQTTVMPTAAARVATTTASALAASATAEPAPDIDGLAVAIAANAARGVKHFDIRLDPPELGRVDVHMSVSRDGKAEALLTADRPETLELLQRDSKTLERALKQAGLDLSNNSLNFSLKGQHRQGDGGGASMARMRSLSDAVVARAEAANASTPIWSTAQGSARLDIRV